MNDTTQAPTQTLNNPTTEQLLTALFGVFDNHIKHLVDQRVNQIFEAHATMKQLDEQWEERIKGFVQEAIDEHEADYTHVDSDEIDDRIGSYVANHDYSETIKRSVEEILSDGDYATEDRVIDIMTDELDIEEKVKEVLRNI